MGVAFNFSRATARKPPQKILATPLLTVRNLEESDSGYYICEARNNYSSSESVSFNFTVMSKSDY